MSRLSGPSPHFPEDSLPGVGQFIRHCFTSDAISGGPLTNALTLGVCACVSVYVSWLQRQMLMVFANGLITIVVC